MAMLAFAKPVAPDIGQLGREGQPVRYPIGGTDRGRQVVVRVVRVDMVPREVGKLLVGPLVGPCVRQAETRRGLTPPERVGA